MNSLYFVNLFLTEINFRIKAGILLSNRKYRRDCERHLFELATHWTKLRKYCHCRWNVFFLLGWMFTM